LVNEGSLLQISKNQSFIGTCPSCKKGKTMITDSESGEIICVNCGRVVIDKATAMQPEWRAFTAEDVTNRARTGTPTSLARHDMGLATVIGNTSRDASGQLLNQDMRMRMNRLRLWDSRTQAHTSTERNLQRAFGQLLRIKDASGLSDAVVEKAAYIYRKAQERGITKGRTIAALMAASVYAACREMGALRTLADIASSSGVKQREVARCYRLVVSILDLKVPNIDALKCVARIANTLDISEKTKRRALDLIRKAGQKRISDGKDPMGLAAAAIYLAALHLGETVNQTTIAQTGRVTEVTVRNRSKELKRKLLD